MTRYQNIDGKRVQLTAEEEAERDADIKAYLDKQPSRRMAELRRQRNLLLAETDYMGLSDNTMSTAWKNYRQALRDITTQTPTDFALSNIKFPEKPTE